MCVLDGDDRAVADVAFREGTGYQTGDDYDECDSRHADECESCRARGRRHSRTGTPIGCACGAVVLTPVCSAVFLLRQRLSLILSYLSLCHSQVEKKGCRYIFNMCGEIWWWVSRRVAPVVDLSWTLSLRAGRPTNLAVSERESRPEENKQLNKTASGQRRRTRTQLVFPSCYGARLSQSVSGRVGGRCSLYQSIYCNRYILNKYDRYTLRRIQEIREYI